jgi:prepilin-type processing-associated H-X9-DG protein
MLNYESSNGSLPPGTKGCCWGTWNVFIMPFMEQSTGFNAYNFLGGADYDPGGGTLLRYSGKMNSTAATFRINSYTCPSDMATSGELSIPSYNYVVNWGNTVFGQYSLPLGCTSCTVPFLGAPFNDLYSCSASSSSPSSCTVGNTYSQSGTVQLSKITDGTSNTMLASELIQGQDKSSSALDLRGFTMWAYSTGFTTYLPPNSQTPELMPSGYCQYPFMTNPPCTAAPYGQPGSMSSYMAARSRHPGGVNAVFGDGRVQFVKNSINISTWRALSTSQGGEVYSSDSF